MQKVGSMETDNQGHAPEIGQGRDGIPAVLAGEDHQPQGDVAI